jgi:asparagine synthase (glutamine-hydrolysing)
MCGIAGLHHLQGEPVSAGVVQEMCSLIGHRGPDDSGLWSYGPIALGHRRLGIIDLSPRARNPMPNEDETVWLVFNGEIYNYRELRRGLRERGHIFRSQTDSEVVLHLYEERGIDCLSELNGMFAFALWDVGARRLLLARDRFGVKPLYYVQVDGTLAFASEAKAFLAVPGFTAAPDPIALAEHFTFQNTLGERTFFRGVKLLPAGHWLASVDGRVEQRQYWDLRFEQGPDLALDSWAGLLRERFESAVTRQLMSDVPLGSYLSGGMDTGAISAVAARELPGLHTFTCGFDLPESANELEQYFDERDESRVLASSLGTVHHELEIGPDAMAPALPRVVWHLDEPRVGISYQILYTTRMIHRYVTVVLSGVGGDELFAGYPWRYQRVSEMSDAGFEQQYYQEWIRFLSDDDKRRLFTDEVSSRLRGFSTFDTFRAELGGSRGYDRIHRALYFDFKTFLASLLLVDDKLAMANSVEARVPFLDNDLVDLVSMIPSTHKFADGEGKIVLKRAMRGLLAPETLARRKQGFTPPDESWYKQEAAIRHIRELILSRRSVDRGYFQPQFLEQILDDHLNGRRNNRFLIWSLMCFEWWNRLFVDREALPEQIGDEAAGHGRTPTVDSVRGLPR